MVVGGVYQIRNCTNGKLYIGSTNDLVRRERKHFSELRNNKHGNQHLQNAWNKYGESCFTFEVLRYIDDEDRLIRAEQFFIDFWETYKPEYGYNIATVAGTSMRGRFGKDHPRYGTRLTDAHKQAISNASKGENNAYYGKYGPEHPRYGTRNTNEHKRLLSERMKGKNNPAYGLTGEKHWNSKLTDKQRREIAKLYVEGTHNTPELAVIYAVGESTVKRTIKRYRKDYE
jgi:group I intron endonuclease